MTTSARSTASSSFARMSPAPPPQRVRTSRPEDVAQPAPRPRRPRSGKIPRNALCGSGKKYKRCHGAVA
jgi:SEC-C motif